MHQEISGFQWIIKWVGYFIIGIGKVIIGSGSPSLGPVLAYYSGIIINVIETDGKIVDHPAYRELFWNSGF